MTDAAVGPLFALETGARESRERERCESAVECGEPRKRSSISSRLGCTPHSGKCESFTESNDDGRYASTFSRFSARSRASVAVYDSLTLYPALTVRRDLVNPIGHPPYSPNGRGHRTCNLELAELSLSHSGGPPGDHHRSSRHTAHPARGQRVKGSGALHDSSGPTCSHMKLHDRPQPPYVAREHTSTFRTPLSATRPSHRTCSQTLSIADDRSLPADATVLYRRGSHIIAVSRVEF
jgi:hypothetical protein